MGVNEAKSGLVLLPVGGDEGQIVTVCFGSVGASCMELSVEELQIQCCH